MSKSAVANTKNNTKNQKARFISIVTVSALIVLSIVAICIFALVKYLQDNALSADVSNDASAISSFEECVEKGNRVQRSIPVSCITVEGETFTEPLPADVTTTNPNPLLEPTDPNPPGLIPGEPIQVTGTTACLTPANDAEVSDICTIGVVTDDSVSYLITLTPELQAQFDGTELAEAGNRLQISGTLVQSPNEQYNVTGTIQVSELEIID